MSLRTRDKSIQFVFKIVLLGLLGPTLVQAQVAQNSTTYKSEIDELLSINTVSVLPFSDNVQGIYSRPLESHLIESLGKMHRWDYQPVNSVGPVLSPEDLEGDLERARQMAGGVTADAFIAGRISKGPNGVTIILSLFLTKDAKLLAKATSQDARRFDIVDLKKEVDSLLAKIITQIPYQGRVLSRDSQRVTVNIGTRDGVQPGQVLSAIQIITATRHPKFNFLINTEKEIIGQIKLLKTDETLSFGIVLTEKEKGAIQKGAKIGGLDFVKYPELDSLNDPSGGRDIKDRGDSAVSFGENPNVWMPTRTPTFGQIGARIGDTYYTSSANLTGVGSLSSGTYFAPSVAIDGELWMTTTFSIHAGFKQGIIPIDNPRAGAAPNKLNQSLTKYEFMFGYNFRFGSNVWGPTVEALLGYMNYRLYVDNSTPEAYTTMNYSGVKAGIQGYFPVSRDGLWSAGAEIFMVFQPNLSETPVSSGASNTTTINMFGLTASRKLRENLKGVAKLEFEQYASSFSGDGTRTNDATSSSQRHTTLSAGVYYMF